MVVNLTGMRFGRLTALRPAGKHSTGHVLWELKCDCGNTVTKPTGYLRKKEGVRSCGCLASDVTSARSKTHGLSRINDATYKVWVQMRRRCREKPGYADRGITVCERWNDFENFLADMGARPEGQQIDRIDNNRGYAPDNCRWASPKENSNNRRNTWRIEYEGRVQTASEWADELGVERQTVIYRHKHGFPLVR